MNPHRAFATTRHGKLHYQSAGDGKPLLLLHATPRSSEAYGNLIPLLAASHRVIAPDTLGFGASDPLPAEASIETLAASVVDLLDALAIDTAAVFGLHTGNKIAAAMAAGWPQRISALMLCGMSHSIILDEQRREAAIKAILAAHPIDPDDVTDAAERRDRIRARDSVTTLYAANYAFDLAVAVSELSLPMLLVELATPQEAHLGPQAPGWVKHVPHCKTAVIERSDRDLLERFPQELAAVILRFLTGLEERSHV